MRSNQMSDLRQGRISASICGFNRWMQLIHRVLEGPLPKGLIVSNGHAPVMSISLTLP